MAKKLLPVLIVLSLFAACGELDTLLPSNGLTYQVNATINGSSLDDCSLVWAGDKISPYFTSFITNDPDLTGLAVFLEDSRGEVAGEKVRYMLSSYADNYDDDSTPADYETGNEEDETVVTEDMTEEADNDPSADSTADEYIVHIPESEKEEKEIDERLIIVSRLDRNMPDFSIPANLEIGQYTLVFQALGKKDVLHRTETVIFYMGNAEFSLKDIQMYFPGVSSGSRLIPPGTILMLEARPDFDKRLDPYIVWYYGKDRIGEGKLSEGAGTILWETPKQTGFHSVRAEIFPFQIQKEITGISREVSVPISSKAVNTGYFFNNIPPAAKAPQELILQYQLSGDLRDSKNPSSGEQALILANEKAPRWTPLDYSYGLAAGPEYEYILPPVSFIHTEEETGGGQLLLHFIPVSNGCIFTAFFPSQTVSGEGAGIQLSLKENILVLRLSVPGEIAIETSIPSPEIYSYTAAVIDFFIRPKRLNARLSLEKDIQSEAISINLPYTLDGKGHIRLGGTGTLEADGISVSEQALEQKKALIETSAIWDEVAVLYSALPLVADLPEDEIIEEGETAATTSSSGLVTDISDISEKQGFPLPVAQNS